MMLLTPRPVFLEFDNNNSNDNNNIKGILSAGLIIY